MDERTMRLSREAYRDWDKFLELFDAFAAKLGHLPTTEDLFTEEGRFLLTVILCHHGSLEAVKRRRAFEARYAADLDYWRPWYRVKMAVDLTCDMVVWHPPSRQALDRLRKIGVLASLQKYHGGWKGLKRRIKRSWSPDYSRFGRPREGEMPGREYWLDRDNVDRELYGVVRALDGFPRDCALNRAELYAMINAINKYHGRLPAMAIRLGYAAARPPMSHWERWANAEAKLREIAFCLGRFPTLMDFRDFGISTFGLLIMRYHSGLKAARARMGYGPITDALLKKRADQLVEVFLALTTEAPTLRSDALWSAIKDRWTGAQLDEALGQFAQGDLGPFKRLLLT